MTDKAKEIAGKLKNAAVFFNNKKETITDGKTLKSEVDLISKEFGWSEDEILSLPVLRRKTYVSLIQSETSRKSPINNGE
jgi:hypothetical protein